MSEESDFKKITIIGTGLIGGSIGLALKKSAYSGQIFGIDRKVIIEKAIHCGAIDQGSEKIEEGVKNADMIVLATPVRDIIVSMNLIKPYLSKKSLVTDTGSTKTDIMEEAENLFSDKHDFIGGHPMAGLEKGGIEYAHPDLFTKKPYIVIPSKKNNPSVELKMSSFIQRIGAIEIKMEVTEHDRVVALISHLPQLIAVSMTNMLGSLVEEKNNPDYFRIGGNVFNEMTRVASSPFTIWNDIYQTNAKWTIKAIEELEEMLNNIKQKITNNPAELENDFSKARHLKEKILKINN
ncbi:MAG: prephenate dehydrogenase [Atribacterota bacterium]